MFPKLLAGLALCAAALAAHGQQAPLPDRLGSPDPATSKAAIEEALKNAATVEPLLLMAAGQQLDAAGKKNDAVFWFYAGQLRARYSPRLKGENSQIILIFTMTGETINIHAQQNIASMDKIIKRVMAWDDKTFPAWAAANNYKPEDLAADRAKAREGLTAMMAKLTANREEYEKLARESQKMLEANKKEREDYAKRVRTDFSAKPMERVVAGKTFRLPANYVTRTGLKQTGRVESQDLVLTTFLPELAGFSRDTPVEYGSLRTTMFVRINDGNQHRNLEELFEKFIATDPPRVKVFGAEAYFFDVYKNPHKVGLPLFGYMNEYVVREDLPSGRIYMSCRAPVSNITNANPRCQLFMRHAKSGFKYNATFSQDYGNDWVKIATRLNAMLDEWFVVSP